MDLTDLLEARGVELSAASTKAQAGASPCRMRG